MLDYKDIIIKRYALGLPGAEIARQLGYSKSGVNDFLNACSQREPKSWAFMILNDEVPANAI